jgi:hypothetical protein
VDGSNLQHGRRVALTDIGASPATDSAAIARLSATTHHPTGLPLRGITSKSLHFQHDFTALTNHARALELPTKVFERADMAQDDDDFRFALIAHALVDDVHVRFPDASCFRRKRFSAATCARDEHQEQQSQQVSEEGERRSEHVWDNTAWDQTSLSCLSAGLSVATTNWNGNMSEVYASLGRSNFGTVCGQ